MKIYLAGPMRGYAEFNYPAFHAAALKLRADGHEVFSPAEHDLKLYGKDISKGNVNGCEELAAKEHGFSLRDAFGGDLAWICAQAEAIALMRGWERSKGASAEKAVAEALGLHVIYLGRAE